MWKWIKKVEKKLPISTEKKKRNLIAIDETVIRMSMMKVYLAMSIKLLGSKELWKALIWNSSTKGFGRRSLVKSKDILPLDYR